MLLQKFLARWDKFISNLLYLSWDTISSGEGTPSTSSFYGLFGPRIAIINKDGDIRILTGLYAIHHYYDADGKLIRRISVRKEVGEGERLIIGDKRGRIRGIFQK